MRKQKPKTEKKGDAEASLFSAPIPAPIDTSGADEALAEEQETAPKEKLKGPVKTKKEEDPCGCW